MNEKMSFGAFLLSLNIPMAEKMFGNCSIMSAELNAIIMALEYVTNNCPHTSNVKTL